MAPAHAEAGWSAVFPTPAGDVTSVAFAVGDGRHVMSVAVSGTSPEGGRLFSDERLLPAEVILDPVSRLVVFRLSGPPGRALPLLADAPLPAGATVKAATGVEGKSGGWVKNVSGKILPLSLLKMEYSARVPRPGTPLLDSNGNVVAVAYQPTGAQSGYAIPAEVVKRVLEDVQRGGHVSRGWIGLNLRPDAKAPQVTRVHEGSPSALAGVKTGDVLLQVGQRNLGEYADAVNAFFFLRPGVATPVKLKRGDQEVVISVTPIEHRAD
ncbi:S1C family serine protease [Luteolibacter soli]|uniref:S1C family serine protease n=1 Tax=Luteolibacter soli TaxID=3135280 RepID=A0ABU9AMZ8_9BACT